jgi:hypothetical protein
MGPSRSGAKFWLLNQSGHGRQGMLQSQSRFQPLSNPSFESIHEAFDNGTARIIAEAENNVPVM